jgi:hypothetical protein
LATADSSFSSNFRSISQPKSPTANSDCVNRARNTQFNPTRLLLLPRIEKSFWDKKKTAPHQFNDIHDNRFKILFLGLEN